MARIAAMVLSLMLATGCTSVARLAVGAAQPNEASMELECMADCLDEDGASCEECAASCFAAHSGGVVLGFSR